MIETTEKSFRACEADPSELRPPAGQNGPACPGQNANLLNLPALFVVVISQLRQNGQLQCRGKLLDKSLGFFRQTIIRQISAQEDYIGVLRHLQEQALEIAP